jgi:hypothetical protein
MKRFWVAIMALAALTSWGMTLEEARKRLPIFASLDDESFVDVVHKKYYANMDKAEFAKFIGYQLPVLPAPKAKLGPIDQWRYETCQKDAAQAPTVLGVNTGLRLCREKFGQ